MNGNISFSIILFCIAIASVYMFWHGGIIQQFNQILKRPWQRLRIIRFTSRTFIHMLIFNHHHVSHTNILKFQTSTSISLFWDEIPKLSHFSLSAFQSVSSKCIYEIENPINLTKTDDWISLHFEHKNQDQRRDNVINVLMGVNVRIIVQSSYIRDFMW